MRGFHITLWIVPILAGCATTSDGGGGVKEVSPRVKEVSPGTYSVPVSRSSSVMFGGTEGVSAAVSEAGNIATQRDRSLLFSRTRATS